MTICRLKGETTAYWDQARKTDRSKRITKMMRVLAVKTRPVAVFQRRFASQEINPIFMRLQRAEVNVPFDRHAVRSWQHVFYAPHSGFGQWNHYAPYYVQGLKMKAYLDGYFDGKALIADPLIYRSVAGNLVRLFIYNPEKNEFDYNAIERAMEKVFGQFQGPGTSGRSRDIVEQEGRVKTRLDVIEVHNPLSNAEILSQYVANQLKAQMAPNIIFDRLVQQMPKNVARRSADPNAATLEVAGFRLRIKGRPRGEEMASTSDFIFGSCPKQDSSVLMDFGKHSIKLRSGMTGVKAWIHFQRPNMAAETNFCHYLDSNEEHDEDKEQVLLSRFPSLLLIDHDYCPDGVKRELEKRAKLAKSLPLGGLWNVECSTDPLVRDLTNKLRQIHEPDHSQMSRFIW